MTDRLVLVVREGDMTARYVWREATVTWNDDHDTVEVTGRRLNGQADVFSGTVAYPREVVLAVETPR